MEFPFESSTSTKIPSEPTVIETIVSHFYLPSELNKLESNSGPADTTYPEAPHADHHLPSDSIDIIVHRSILMSLKKILKLRSKCHMSHKLMNSLYS